MAVPINTDIKDIQDTRQFAQQVVQWLRELESTVNGKGASRVGIEDAESQFTGTTVEDALSELADAAGL